MSFTGAADRVDASGGFGQGETRPQAFTGLNGKGYLIGRTQDRIIEIADISDPDTSTYVSAVIGNPNSMAAHNGSLYVFIGQDLVRFDTPFSNTDTGTDVFTINETPRALTSDGTNLYYIHQLSVLNFLYRIDDLDGTPNVVALGRVGSGNANIRGLSWHDGFFWGVDATTDKLVKITLTEDSDDPHTLENVGSFSQFGGPLTNPQGFGVINGVGYVSALDNEGSLWELRDFKFTADIDDQEWTVGTTVSIDAPATEDGASPITYAISPALPAGVALDTSTGEISGEPTAETAQADYTLTATDDNSIEATLTFSASVAASIGALTPPTFTAPASDYEINERADDTIDSTDFFSGHTSLAFDSGYTPPSWITISGLDIVITDAPDVTDDTDYDIELTATNDDGDVDGTITVSVQQIDSAPVIGTLSRIDVNEGASKTVDLSGSLQNTDDLVITSSQSWVSISGLSLVITTAPSVAADTDYTVNLRAESDATSETDTGSVVIRVADVPIPVVNNPPSFSDTSYSFSDVAIAVNTVVGTVAATDADNDPLTYTLTGTDASDFAIDADGEITVATELTHSDTYTFNVVADDATDTTSVAVTVTAAAAAVSNLPIWQTGSALESSVDALASASIDITGKVSGETEVTALRGVLDWMEWDGTTLDITEAPIFRKDTVFRVRFRAKSADGSTDATYLLTVNGSRLIWMHSTLLCKPPINYEAGRVEIRGTSTVVSEMTDNSYKTYSTEDDVDIDVSDADGNATKIDAVAFVSKNVDSYSLTPTGGSGSGFSDRDVPSSFDTRDGRSQSRVLGRFQWEFYPLPAQITATSVRLQFSGTDVEIYAVMLLELLTEIRDGEFVDVIAEKVDRAGSVSESDTGRVDRASRLGAERWKWETQYLLNIGARLTFDSEAEVLRFLRDTPDVFCVQEAARYPARMHLAIVSNLELTPEQKGLYKGAGSIVPFSVSEV